MLCMCWWLMYNSLKSSSTSPIHVHTSPTHPDPTHIHTHTHTYTQPPHPHTSVSTLPSWIVGDDVLSSASLPDDTSQRMQHPHFLPPVVAGLVSCESLLDTSQLREKEGRDKINCSDILHWTTIINRWFTHMLENRHVTAERWREKDKAEREECSYCTCSNTLRFQTNCSDILHWTTCTIINRSFTHREENRYLNHSIKKVFITATAIPGCTEDRSKLATILPEAKRKQLPFAFLARSSQCIQQLLPHANSHAPVRAYVWPKFFVVYIYLSPMFV